MFVYINLYLFVYVLVNFECNLISLSVESNASPRHSYIYILNTNVHKCYQRF